MAAVFLAMNERGQRETGGQLGPFCVNCHAPLAVRASKRVMKLAGELPDEQGWAINNAAVPEVFGSADAMEGPIAFAEKRPPNWSGK